MPYVLVQVGGPLTRDQRKKIANDISESLLKVAGKPISATYVVFDEVNRDQWVVGGKLLDEKA